MSCPSSEPPNPVPGPDLQCCWWRNLSWWPAVQRLEYPDLTNHSAAVLAARPIRSANCGDCPAAANQSAAVYCRPPPLQVCTAALYCRSVPWSGEPLQGRCSGYSYAAAAAAVVPTDGVAAAVELQSSLVCPACSRLSCLTNNTNLQQ